MSVQGWRGRSKGTAAFRHKRPYSEQSYLDFNLALNQTAALGRYSDPGARKKQRGAY